MMELNLESQNSSVHFKLIKLTGLVDIVILIDYLV